MSKLHYAISTASFGGRITEKLVETMSSVRPSDGEPWAVEICPQAFGEGDEDRLVSMFRNGIAKPVSIHIPFGGAWNIANEDMSMRRVAVAKIIAILERWSEFPIQNATIHPGTEPVSPSVRAVHMMRSSKSLSDLEPIARNIGISLNVEYLPRTCPGNCEAELLELISDLNPASTGILLDVNHVMDRADELPRIAEKLGPRLKACHFSDYDNVDEQHWFPGTGAIKWKKLLETLSGLDHDLLLILETASCSKCADQSAAFGYVLQAIHYLQSGCDASVMLSAPVAMG